MHSVSNFIEMNEPPSWTLKLWLLGCADLRKVSDVSLAEGHVLGLLHDVSVNDQHVGELGGEAQLDLSAAVKVEAHALWKFCNIKKKNTLDWHKCH